MALARDQNALTGPGTQLESLRFDKLERLCRPRAMLSPDRCG